MSSVPKHDRDAPLVTFALLAYNQETYISEAVEGAFSQTCEPLQIILSDDCSTDRTFDIMRRMASHYKGRHHVVLNRNRQNQGIAVHFDNVVRRSNGEIVILAAGDDISLPNRASISAAPFFENRKTTLVETNHVDFTDASTSYRDPRPAQGICHESQDYTLIDFFRRQSPAAVGARRALRRDAYLAFPPLPAGCPSEDTPSAVRLLLHGTGKYIDAVTVLRRIHSNNLSNGNRILHYDFAKLLNQYVEDIAHASSTKLISGTLARHLNELAAKYVQSKELVVKSYYGPTDSWVLIWNILANNALCPRDRLYLAKYWLARKVSSKAEKPKDQKSPPVK